MTTLHDFLRTLPGRCQECCRHPEKQGGHAPGCSVPASLGRAGMEQTVAAHPNAVALVDAAIMRRVAAGREFSLNTIRHELTSLTPDERPVIGARMNALGRRHCVKVGEEPSNDAATHGKSLSIWKAKEAA